MTGPNAPKIEDKMGAMRPRTSVRTVLRRPETRPPEPPRRPPMISRREEVRLRTGTRETTRQISSPRRFLYGNKSKAAGKDDFGERTGLWL